MESGGGAPPRRLPFPRVPCESGLCSRVTSRAIQSGGVLVAKYFRIGLLAFGLVLSCSDPAQAWTEFLSMDVLPESVGWTLICPDQTFQPGPGSSALSGGLLTLTSTWFREYRAPASWINTVNAAAGYTIEFRMRIVSGPSRYPDWRVGVWYEDRAAQTVISIDSSRVYAASPPGPYASLDGTAWHTYRIVVLGNWHRVYVDESLAIEFQHPGASSGAYLQFGDLGGPGTTISEWDYFAYETQSPVPVAATSWGRIKSLYRR